ncbi:MAG: SulP family inorganic anion transporter [Nakamurella sp.]
MPSLMFSSLRGYRASWAVGDGVAALTLLAIAVPEQLATARLAGMPPITGLYAFVAGSVMFALLGSNRQMSVGADSTIAPLFAAGVTALAVPGSAVYLADVGILAVMVGLIVALVGLLRLGWIAQFLSAPIISGFLGGVAVIVVVGQLPDLLGLPSGGGSTLHRIGTVLADLRLTNWWTLGIGVGVFVVALLGHLIDRRIPGPLIGLVISAVLVGALRLHGHGVAVLGVVAHGGPRLGLHGMSFSVLGSLAPMAGVVALIVVSQSAVTTTAFADQGRYQVEVGRDFLGVGAGSVVAGLVGAFPVNASPPRTAAVASASGRTQAAGLAAAVGVVLLNPAAALLQDVPLATLAAVLIFIAGQIFHVRELIAIAKFDRFEFALAMVTLLTVALVGVEQGIVIAVALAILDRTRLSDRPALHVLGRITGTTSWTPVSGPEDTAQLPGVLVVLFATPLWYADAARFRTELDAAKQRAIGPPRVLVLDTIGMSDIDYTGSRTLREVLDQLDRDGVRFAMARTGSRVRAGLERSDLLGRIGPQNLFASVNEAVLTLGPLQRPDPLQ